MKQLKLKQLSRSELEKKEMRFIAGGYYAACSCMCLCGIYDNKESHSNAEAESAMLTEELG